jgi:signal transduction histidine kinase
VTRWASGDPPGGTGRARLWPVLLILAAIVLLPTLCVLWLLSDALETGRLALRQRLSEAYRGPLGQVREALEDRWQRKFADLDQRTRALEPLRAQALFGTLVEEQVVESAVLRTPAGDLLFPMGSCEGRGSAELPETWSRAERLEYAEGKAEAALGLYRTLAASPSPPDLQALASRSEARCLAKLGDRAGALKVLLDPAWEGERAECRDPRGRLLALDARLHALQLIDDPGDAAFQSAAALLDRRLRDYGAPCLPSGQRRFLMRELRSLWPGCPPFRTLEAEDLASRHLESDPGPAEPGVLSRSRLAGVWRIASTDRALEALFSESGALSPERLLGDLLAGSNLIDPQEARIEPRPTREPASKEALLSLACRGPLSEWSLDLHLRGADPLAVAAARQVSLRIGIACLVIGLSLALAGIVASLIGRQVRLSRLKSDWTATVAHELRTPLAGMRALVETLIDGRYRGQEQAQEYIRLIAKENERLTRLVENFLSFSRMERKKVVFERSRIDPRQVVDRAAALVSGKFTANGHRFSVEVSGNPPEVFADADALVTVLLNLLENAFKYSGSEKVIALRCGARGGRVRFEVEDNGTGIPVHARRRIFDRFYQVDRRLSRGTSGCGLGLSIVKYIVEAHGGVVRVESEPGSGSRFTVEISAMPGREAPAVPGGGRTDGA